MATINKILKHPDLIIIRIWFQKNIRLMLYPQHFKSNFTINPIWYATIDLNLGSILIYFFTYSSSHKIYCENVVDITLLQNRIMASQT